VQRLCDLSGLPLETFVQAAHGFRGAAVLVREQTLGESDPAARLS
jgi:hypothetical protein